MIPAPLSIRTGGRISSTLRPQWEVKPARSAAAATSSIAACASSSSGTPRQCSAAIASLSSSRTRSLRRSSVKCSWAKFWTRRVHACSSRSTWGAIAPGISTSEPCEPRYAIEPSETIRRASEARRPDTQATTP